MKSNGEILITSHRQIGGSFPERITNEKFMFIIHKPAAYASAISLYIINVAQYRKSYRCYPDNISMA